MNTLRAVVLVELLPLKMLLWVSSQEGTSYSTRDHDININIQCEYIYIYYIHNIISGRSFLNASCEHCKNFMGTNKKYVFEVLKCIVQAGAAISLGVPAVLAAGVAWPSFVMFRPSSCKISRSRSHSCFHIPHSAIVYHGSMCLD